ncbi:MAG: hypothetical protein U9Q81_22315 [Pseudomonadota bacterium]|nr:hypothetical protein [Pseudomonadota bacterium]
MTVLHGWRELDDASTETLLPSGTANLKWVPGKRALVGTREVQGTDQVFYYSIDTGVATQLTFDSAQKRFPIMWWDPATRDYLLAANRNDVEIGIWALDDSQAWYLAGTVRPPTDIPYVFRPDWFTWDDASYLSYLMHTERSGKRQNFLGTGEAWVTRISGTGPFRHRQVNDPSVTRIKDVENLPLGSTVYIYYAEIIDDQNYRRLIHRAATGLF